MPMPKSHILLIESSAARAEEMLHTLERAGFEVDWQTTADNALATLAVRRPDLVIVDFHLPDLLGDEFCKMMRSRWDTRDVPVILLTAREADRLALRALQSGVDDYFEKSVQPSAILPRVQSLLRKGRAEAARRLPTVPPLGRPRLLLGTERRTRLSLAAIIGGFEDLGVEVRLIHSLQQVLSERERIDGILLTAGVLAEDQSGCWPTLLDREATALAPPLMILAPPAHSNAFLLEAGADDVIDDETEPELLCLKVKNQILRHRVRKENLELESRYREQELRASMASALEEKNRELSLSYQRLQETQSQLVHSERMAALGQMVAGMAHEINNPLAYVTGNIHNVMGWLSTLDGVVLPALDPRQAERWDKIRRRLAESLEGLERVKELVLQLRTYSRLDEAEFKAIDVEDSVLSVLRIISHRLREQEVELSAEYQYRHPLECNPGAFNQVVMNLVSNALDAVPRGGRITLVTREREGRFQLVVRDNGPGVPAAIRERLFEPFFTTKPVGKGTGLGLAISRQIVEAHGGVLLLEEPEDGLTTFSVILPNNGGKRRDP